MFQTLGSEFSSPNTTSLVSWLDVLNAHFNSSQNFLVPASKGGSELEFMPTVS